MIPIIVPLGRNSAGTVTHALTVCSCLGPSGRRRVLLGTCCQMWPDSPAQRVPRTAGEASRRGPKGSNLWFASWDVRSDRHMTRSWLVSCSCRLHLWCSSSDLVDLHSWCCCKQLWSAGHQVSACKIHVWRFSCQQQRVFRSRSVEVGPSFLEVGIDFPVP